jgi:hypothetical protein
MINSSVNNMGNETFVEQMLNSAKKKQEKIQPFQSSIEPEKDVKPNSENHEMTKEEMDKVKKFTANLHKGTTE